MKITPVEGGGGRSNQFMVLLNKVFANYFYYQKVKKKLAKIIIFE